MKDRGDIMFVAFIVACGAGIVGAIVGISALITWTVKTVWGS